MLGPVNSLTGDTASLFKFSGRLSITGPNSINKIVINDSQNAKVGTSYTINPNSVTRTAPGQLSLLLSSELTISYTAGFGSSVELDTAKGGATIQDNGSNVFMTVVAGTGVDKLIGPNLANTWGMTGVNQGTLPNLAFRGVENQVTPSRRISFSTMRAASGSSRGMICGRLPSSDTRARRSGRRPGPARSRPARRR